MISVIITARKEAKTIKRAVLAFAEEKGVETEIIVVAPDKETLRVAGESAKGVKLIRDRGRGKPAALNLALKEARGEKIVFSDGDVAIRPDALKYLAASRGDLISGRPVPKLGRDDMYAFWHKVLLDTAHQLRLTKSKRKEYFPVSGYLFLAQREALRDFSWPEESLAEDDYLSHYVFQKGGRINYQSRAEVVVRGAGNFSDWLKQKVRTLGASYQIPKEWKNKEPRSLGGEAVGAAAMWRTYGRSWKQKYWLINLFSARLQAWLTAFIKVKLSRQKREKIWQRVESTK